MDNLSKQPEMYKILKHQTADPTFTINEIKRYYKQLNRNIIETMDRLDDILMLESFNERDRQYINKRDIHVYEFKLAKEDLLKHSDIILPSLIEASLSESIERAIAFFGSPDRDDWYNKLVELKTEFLKLEQDTDWLLDSLDILFKTSHSFYSGLKHTTILEIMNKHNYVKINEIDGINFNFGFVSNLLSNEPDILRKKNIILEAITEREMYCLNLNFDPQKYKPNVDFKTKCLKALEILDFQIQNTTKNRTVEVTNTQSVEIIDENTEPESDRQAPNKEFTTKRQVLAIYYIFNELDKATNLVDRSKKAKFIHFLTGKNESNIYKALAEPHKGLDNEKNKKSAIKDFEFIIQHFRELGLNSIVQRITNDIQEA